MIPDLGIVALCLGRLPPSLPPAIRKNSRAPLVMLPDKRLALAEHVPTHCLYIQSISTIPLYAVQTEDIQQNTAATHTGYVKPTAVSRTNQRQTTINHT